MPFLNLLFIFPKQVTETYFSWLAPLMARIIMGYSFMMIGWAKLNNLELVTENFKEWGISSPEIMAPFVSGWECFGGMLLLVGLMTRISATGLAVTMLVAIFSVQIADVETFQDFVGLEEVVYFALFSWLAIAGAGKVSLDHIIERYTEKKLIKLSYR